MKSVSVLSPAKLNIHLHIVNKREDGYHNILSLFQMISLHDKLRFSLLNKNKGIKLTGMKHISIEKNLIYKAIILFREYTGIEAGISAVVNKHIPEQAGLGGGSSNAAATLRALNFLFDYPLSKQKLAEIALQLGSDVRFFLTSPAATVSGRGEHINPLSSRKDLLFFIMMPDFTVSTQKAYSWWDNEHNAVPFTHINEKKLRSLYTKAAPETWPFFNSFAPLILKRYPELNLMDREISELSPAFTGLSGSGSAFFAVFNKKTIPESSVNRLRKTYPHFLFAEALDTIPEIKVFNNT
jgi:4-diphosphocytidyl-2-C-methyl-D-erythritol kinase